MIQRTALLLASMALATSAWCTTGSISEDFSTAFSDTGTTAVWDRIARKIHVPFVVQGEESIPIHAGSGADGVFDSTTMYGFDVNGGTVTNSVTLLTSRTYHFTTFTLPAGVTLRGQGTTALDIRVQGNVSIAGTIDLSGGSGGAAFTPATATTNGGTACCGGGAGGSGISTLVLSGDGATPSSSGTGGLAGTVSAGGGIDAGAGGGGGNRYVGANGAANAPASGNGGPAFGDLTLATLIGGAGGGGGGGNTALGNAGGGGGAGGGALSLFLGGNLSLAATGSIKVDGGAGGAAGAPLKAGGGGGGGGGSMRVFGAGTAVDDGSMTAVAGNGGAATVSGGIGSNGIQRFGFSDHIITGSGTENPGSVTGSVETTYGSVQSFTAVSKPYDTQNSNPHYTRFTKTETLNAGDSISYEIAGSSDRFVGDDTGYVPVSRITEINGKRYFRIRVVMQAASNTASPSVNSMQVNYDLNFAYSIAGCARVHSASSGAGPWAWALLGGYFWLLSAVARRWSARAFPTPAPTRHSLPH